MLSLSSCACVWSLETATSVIAVMSSVSGCLLTAGFDGFVSSVDVDGLVNDERSDINLSCEECGGNVCVSSFLRGWVVKADRIVGCDLCPVCAVVFIVDI